MRSYTRLNDQLVHHYHTHNHNNILLAVYLHFLVQFLSKCLIMFNINVSFQNNFSRQTSANIKQFSRYCVSESKKSNQSFSVDVMNKKNVKSYACPLLYCLRSRKNEIKMLNFYRIHTSNLGHEVNFRTFHESRNI